MSEEQQEVSATLEVPKAKFPIVPLIGGVILAALFATCAVGGVAYWAIKTGKLPIAGVKTVTVVVQADPLKTKLVPLDPLLVNLADPDGKGYLRVALTLKIEDPPVLKEAKPKEEKEAKGPPKNEFEAEERDAIFGTLGKETSDQLLAVDGKERLKLDVKAALAEHVPEIKVDEVLITEFWFSADAEKEERWPRYWYRRTSLWSGLRLRRQLAMARRKRPRVAEVSLRSSSIEDGTCSRSCL